MKYVEFETESGGMVTIFFANSLTVQKYRNRDGVDEICVLDGLHNNGGWKVKGTYQEAVDKILYAKVI